MTLEQLKEDLILFLNDDSINRFSDAQRIRAINIAYKKIINYFPWHFLIVRATKAMVAGTQSYAKPTDCAELRSLWWEKIHVGNKIGLLDKKTYESCLDWTTSTGTPYYYYMLGSNYELYPKPDTANTLQVEYIKYVPDLVALASVVDGFPADFQYLIGLEASKILKKTNGEGDVDEANDLGQDVIAALEKMKTLAGTGEDDRADHVIDSEDLNRDDVYYT